MTKIAVTGANGQLGRLTVKALVERGVDPSRVFALTRDPSQVEDLAALGVQVREADFDRADTLGPALAGIDNVLLVSTLADNRVEQHRALIEAAKDSEVKLVAYTSILDAKDCGMLLAADHVATEDLLAGSGVDYVILRNGWYSENYTAGLADAAEKGALVAAADEGGKTSVAARKDYAEAAAVVLATPGHQNKIYELGGDESVSLPEIAATFSAVLGRDIPYNRVSPDELVASYVAMGFPEHMAHVFADAEQATGRGVVATDSGDLSRLIGRPTTPFEETVREAASELA
ncbi:MAG TPA: SDR family oxidoreductase [Baekduia sp.]|nr:SDR family oxidoreductase [Baekduia sp.]